MGFLILEDTGPEKNTSTSGPEFRLCYKHGRIPCGCLTLLTEAEEFSGDQRVRESAGLSSENLECKVRFPAFEIPHFFVLGDKIITWHL